MAPSSTRMRSRARLWSLESVGAVRTDITTDSGMLPLPEGERGGVRGFGSLLVGGVQDVFEHALNVSNDIVVPVAQDEIAHRVQNTGSVGITVSILIVLPAIQFHDELGVRTEKIDDEAIDRHLPLELPAVESAVAQTKPQHTLRVGLIAAKPPSRCGAPSRHPTPLTPPLSPTGRGSAPCSPLTSWLGRGPSR